LLTQGRIDAAKFVLFRFCFNHYADVFFFSVVQTGLSFSNQSTQSCTCLFCTDWTVRNCCLVMQGVWSPSLCWLGLLC
jgi:hypothetical protein